PTGLAGFGRAAILWRPCRVATPRRDGRFSPHPPMSPCVVGGGDPTNGRVGISGHRRQEVADLRSRVVAPNGVNRVWVGGLATVRTRDDQVPRGLARWVAMAFQGSSGQGWRG